MRPGGGARAVIGSAIVIVLFADVAALCLSGWPSPPTIVGSGKSSPLAAASPAPIADQMALQSATPGPSASPRQLEPTPSAPVRSPAAPSVGPRSTGAAAPAAPLRYHVPILNYHRIAPKAEAGGSIPYLVVTPATFTVQLKALYDAGWHTITMATLADFMQANRPIPPKTFVITFDDGWEDGYKYAFPIMRGYGFVGTFFVIGDRIGVHGFLSAQEMRTLEAAGDEIGNHTGDHHMLSNMSAPFIRQDVERGAAAIARAVGHRPVSLAYPKSAVNATVIAVVAQIPGLEIAATTGGRIETWLGRYDVGRIGVFPATTPAFLLAKLSA